MTRRSFVGRALGSGLALAACPSLLPARAVEPIVRKGAPRFHLSLAAYSLRDFFKEGLGDKSLTMLDFVDYCADHGCDGAEVTSYYFPKTVTPEYLLELKKRAFLRGVEISGTAVGNNFTRAPGPERDKEIALVKLWTDYAQVLGAPHIRVFAGDGRDVPMAEAKRRTIAALEECGEYAARKGVWLGLENHGGIVSQVNDLLEIVRAAKSPAVAVNLDTGNFYSDADPYEEMARLAPYAVNVQLKVEVNRRGRGKEPTDLDRVIKMLQQANYQGYVALEYEAKDPWTDVPIWLKRMHDAFARL